ncbi:DUF1793-domain-containing protein [Mycena sanguinolenta]|uniref:DUF1793-domain-containing protein n=1 Tax=Mycena sanguinolenta TaxID=230812 RepID=A0A8H7DK10_9AGAR|nr:DUF1793-domain-containing protein [Mycena sanguinolenta]
MRYTSLIMVLLPLLVAFLSAVTTVSGVISWTAAPFLPPSYPLAVRTPYLSAWLPQGTGAALNDVWPQFWNGQILGWAGFVRVDGTAYSFLGNPAVPGSTFTKATQTSAKFTSTQSTFVMTAGPVELTVNFLSPVEPTNLLHQSIPFSYLAVSAVSTDGAAHTVAIYNDISAEWVSGDISLVANWTTTTSSVYTHQVQLATQTQFGEFSGQGQTEYGSVYFSCIDANALTYQTGQDTIVRAQFIKNGALPNTQDTNFRAVNNDWPVFAFAHTITVGTTVSTPVKFTIGQVRDPAIEYIIAGNVYQKRSYYWWSTFSTVAALISDFINAYPTALATANTFDAKVQADATSKVSGTYADIAALAVRQAFGATELTISKASDGSWNTSDIMMFMKGIDFQRWGMLLQTFSLYICQILLCFNQNINTVDVIYPAWPIFMYTNPTLGKYLLNGLLAYQATGQYPNAWAVHDLGTEYPAAIGHNLGMDEKMPIEESGNMLIMSLDYLKRTQDTSLASTYTAQLDQWATYLVENTLYPADQLATTDFSGSLPNQTNLAATLGNTGKSATYASTAASYMISWQEVGMSSDGTHLLLEYGVQATNMLAYNLAADTLLGTGIVPVSVMNTQSTYYANNFDLYGFPIDTRSTYASAMWSLWTATTTSTAVRDAFISKLHNWLTSGLTNIPFGDRFLADTGTTSTNMARPVVGGVFILASVFESGIH